jgi:hypothetical protein
MYGAVLMSALNRLPLKLPQRGPGRRHADKAVQPVTFDDVAGVDEAKEELQEVVVRACLSVCLSASCLCLWLPDRPPACLSAACDFRFSLGLVKALSLAFI